jgi:hypothetical protein
MINCAIIRDLLPLYADDVVSKESKALISEHLAACGTCKDELDKLQGEVRKLHADNAKMNVLKSMKRKIHRRNVIIGVSASIIVVVLAIFIGVKVIGDKPIVYYDGLVNVRVNYVDYYKNDEGITIVIADPAKNSEIISKIPVLDITCTQNYYSNKSTGRTIIRNGEKVRVEYIYYTENNLTKMQSNKEKGELVFRLTHGDFNGSVPVRCEVYYLTDLRVANSMSDKEYDDYRHTGTLIWSGILE